MGCHFLLQGSSPFRDQTYGSCVAGGFFTTEPPGKPHGCLIECRILWIFLIVSLGQIMYSFLVHLPGELQQSPPCQKLLTTSSLVCSSQVCPSCSVPCSTSPPLRAHLATGDGRGKCIQLHIPTPDPMAKNYWALKMCQVPLHVFSHFISIAAPWGGGHINTTTLPT